MQQIPVVIYYGQDRCRLLVSSETTLHYLKLVAIHRLRAYLKGHKRFQLYINGIPMDDYRILGDLYRIYKEGDGRIHFLLI